MEEESKRKTDQVLNWFLVPFELVRLCRPVGRDLSISLDQNPALRRQGGGTGRADQNSPGAPCRPNLAPRRLPVPHPCHKQELDIASPTGSERGACEGRGQGAGSVLDDACRASKWSVEMMHGTEGTSGRTSTEGGMYRGEARAPPPGVQLGAYAVARKMKHA